MESLKTVYQANGKLMLFGEYAVMRGVPALAFPVKMGQTMQVFVHHEFVWQSFEASALWFEVKFSVDLEILDTNNSQVAEKLMLILADTKKHNPDLFNQPLRFEVRSNFNRNWGFGSSATLISLIAQWSGCDPYSLNDKHFGGSAYDIACATATGPILYYKNTREVKEIVIPEAITEKLLFVYLGKKQNSQKEVLKFSDFHITQNQLREISDMVLRASQASDIESFEALIDNHELALSTLLQRPTLKNLEFSDYEYSIKSLGAWGGDFFMATCRNIDEARMYFIEKNKEVVFTWKMLRD